MELICSHLKRQFLDRVRLQRPKSSCLYRSSNVIARVLRIWERIAFRMVPHASVRTNQAGGKLERMEKVACSDVGPCTLLVVQGNG